MTLLGATTLNVLTDEQIEQLLEKHEAKIIAKLGKNKCLESPMTTKETARYLRCHENTVRKNWSHLRHMAGGTPYWLASEILEYIKEQ
jgi:hypothetical protein